MTRSALVGFVVAVMSVATLGKPTKRLWGPTLDGTRLSLVSPKLRFGADESSAPIPLHR